MGVEYDRIIRISICRTKTRTYIPEKKEHSDEMYAERENVKNGLIPGRVMLFLWALVLLSVIFCVLIFLVPPGMFETYRFLSNIFECAIALFCMFCCLYAYRTWSERVILLIAAFAFGGYALSNTFWYLYSNAFSLNDEFSSISELGFLGVMLFFIVAFRIEFPKKPCPVSVRIVSGGLFLSLALITIGIAGINPSTVLSTVWLLIIALFIDAALDHGVYQYSLLWSGICLWSFASISFGLWYDIITRFVSDEVQIPFAPNLLTWDVLFSTIIGPVFFLSLLLIQLGIFAYLNSPE
jgi:hypothetical protein